jgi:hypothetical protein
MFCYAFAVVVCVDQVVRRKSGVRASASFVAGQLALIASLFAGEVCADGRQLHGAVLAGAGLLSTQSQLFVGGAVAGQLGYGLTDAFRLYGIIEYRFGVSFAAMGDWSHVPSAVVGVGYSLDVLSIVPWAAIELRAGVRLSHGGAASFVPGAGARLGVDWLLRRYLALTFQGAYTLCWADGSFAHDASVLVGPRWSMDL